MRAGRSIHLLAIVAAAAALALFSGLPRMRRNTPVAPPIGTWLSHLRATPVAAAWPRELELVREALDRPGRFGARIELEVARLCLGAGGAPYVARLVSGYLDRSAVPAAAPESRAFEDIPLRSPDDDDPLGVERLARSASNAAKLPAGVREAIGRLAAVVERCHAKLLPNRAAMDETGTTARMERRWSEGADGMVETAENALVPESAADAAAAMAVLADAAGDVVERLREYSGPLSAAVLEPIDPGDDLPSGILLRSELEAGTLLITDASSSVIPLRGVAVAIDLGGDDRYFDVVAAHRGSTGGPLACVVLDLGGDDRYTARAGRIGRAGPGEVRVVIDVSGNDRYESERAAFASANGGASLLVDLDGDDVYRIGRFGLGFGASGVAALLDARGEDRYHADAWAMGCGVDNGVGCLIDLDGDDAYVVRDPAGDAYAMGSASGTPDGPGGLGILCDRAGADLYRGGSRSLGFAVGRSLGWLIDMSGDDAYQAGDESLGSGVYGGMGLVLERGGDDDFLAGGRSLGFGDRGIGVFLDEQGADTHMARSPSLGAFVGPGQGLFVDP